MNRQGTIKVNRQEGQQKTYVFIKTNQIVPKNPQERTNLRNFHKTTHIETTTTTNIGHKTNQTITIQCQ